MVTPRWRKSSRSGGNAGGNCVEVAEVVDRVLVRDSKDAAGPTLAVAPGAWRRFLGALPGLDR